MSSNRHSHPSSLFALDPAHDSGYLFFKPTTTCTDEERADQTYLWEATLAAVAWEIHETMQGCRKQSCWHGSPSGLEIELARSRCISVARAADAGMHVLYEHKAAN